MDPTKANKPSFDIRDGRAMISLGPLSAKRFCTYACAFCYVHTDFGHYPSLEVAEICSYLSNRSDEFDVVYLSGDTDSLARPRTAKGLELMDALVRLDKDLLFTTRAPLTDEDLDHLSAINRRLADNGNILFGCVSISRLHSAPHIEPRPVPTPETRLGVLRGLHERGIVSVLAMRPFLPVIPVSEYVELVQLAAPFVDVVLGEVWYADKAGLLERQVLGQAGATTLEFEEHKMDFDSNDALWKVWKGDGVRSVVAGYCAEAHIPFFMRSRPAIEYIRARRSQ